MGIDVNVSQRKNKNDRVKMANFETGKTFLRKSI